MTSERALVDIERNAQELKQRRLDIIAELAEMKRAFVVERHSSSFIKRVTLEAELAQLTADEGRAKAAAMKAKVERRIAMDESLLYQLKALLEANGLSALIDEAKNKSGYVDAEYHNKTKE